MDPAPCPYVIRINGHLGVTMLSAFPALAPQHHDAHTVLTGLLDRSALYGVLAEIEALGLDLLELRKLTPDRESRQATTAHRDSHDQAGKAASPASGPDAGALVLGQPLADTGLRAELLECPPSALGCQHASPAWVSPAEVAGDGRAELLECLSGNPGGRRDHRDPVICAYLPGGEPEHTVRS